MPFEYTPYRSPYAGAIADLIGRQGDIAAERALADAKARTATVGAITNSLANIAQYRADAPKRELQQMQLAEARQRMADAAEARTAGNTLGTLVNDTTYREGFQPEGATPDGSILPKGPSLVADMGNGLKLLDKNAIAQQMAQAGHGDWFLKNSNLIDNLNKSSQEMHGYKQAQLQRMATLYMGLPETFSNEARIASAQALLDANGDALPPAEREALQKAIGVGDLRGIDAMARRMMPVPDIAVINTPAGGSSTLYDKNTKEVVGTITGPPLIRPYAERENEALGIPADQRTPEQQAMVDSWNARHPETANTQWVKRNGAWVEIKKGTSQPGDVPASEVPVAPSTPSIEQNIDFASVVQAIKDGRQPPPSFERPTAVDLALRSKLEQSGVDVTKLRNKWVAAQAFTRNLNSAQRINYNQLATSAVNTIEQMQQTAIDLKLAGPNAWNSLTLDVLTKWANGNDAKAKAAVRYLADAAALKEELAQLASGGYKPTESGFKLASDLVQTNYSLPKLLDALDETKRLMSMRVNASADLLPQEIGTTPVPNLQAGGGPPAGAKVRVFNSKTGKLE